MIKRGYNYKKDLLEELNYSSLYELAEENGLNEYGDIVVTESGQYWVDTINGFVKMEKEYNNVG